MSNKEKNINSTSSQDFYYRGPWEKEVMMEIDGEEIKNVMGSGPREFSPRWEIKRELPKEYPYETFYENGNLKEYKKYVGGGYLYEDFGPSVEFYDKYDDRDSHFEHFGFWNSYYEDGIIKEEGMIDQISNFEKISDDNPVVISGQPHGFWIDFYENGGIKSVGFYNNGKGEGLWTLFDNDGMIFRQFTVKDGGPEGLYREYSVGYKTKVPILRSEGFYYKGYKHGPWKIYFEDGSLQFSENYVDGHRHGRSTFHHQSTQDHKDIFNSKDRLGRETFYVKGESVGLETVWDYEGTLEEQSYYYGKGSSILLQYYSFRKEDYSIKDPEKLKFDGSIHHIMFKMGQTVIDYYFGPTPYKEHNFKNTQNGGVISVKEFEKLQTFTEGKPDNNN